MLDTLFVQMPLPSDCNLFPHEFFYTKSLNRNSNYYRLTPNGVLEIYRGDVDRVAPEFEPSMWGKTDVTRVIEFCDYDFSRNDCIVKCIYKVAVVNGLFSVWVSHVISRQFIEPFQTKE